MYKMIRDLLIATFQKITVTTISQDGIFKEQLSYSNKIPCRVTNANSRDLGKLQHLVWVDTEIKKMYVKPCSHHDVNIKYGDKILYDWWIYEITNIYAPMDSTGVHHMKYLLKRIIQWNSN